MFRSDRGFFFYRYRLNILRENEANPEALAALDLIEQRWLIAQEDEDEDPDLGLRKGSEVVLGFGEEAEVQQWLSEQGNDSLLIGLLMETTKPRRVAEAPKGDLPALPDVVAEQIVRVRDALRDLHTVANLGQAGYLTTMMYQYTPGRDVWVVSDRLVVTQCPKCNGRGVAVVDGVRFNCSECRGRGTQNIKLPVPLKRSIHHLEVTGWTRVAVYLAGGNSRSRTPYRPMTAVSDKPPNRNTCFFLTEEACQAYIDQHLLDQS